MYSVNIEPHTQDKQGTVCEFPLDVDEHCVAECNDKKITLEQDSDRYQALPHMMDAQWDFVKLSMESLARDYPEHFFLQKSGTSWTWENKPLGIKDTFNFGDSSSLAMDPFEYIRRQNKVILYYLISVKKRRLLMLKSSQVKLTGC